jgi:AraC-like DNA-binding protein
MDPLAGLVDGPRAERAQVIRAVMAPPWSIRVADEAPLALVAVTRGGLWFRRDGADARWLDADSVALVRGPEPYVVSSGPDLEPTIVVLPGQDCRSLDGTSVAQSLRLGLRSWGTGPLDGGPADGTTEMLIGTYESVGAVGQRLLDTLPGAITTSALALDSPLVALFDQEIDKASPGQPVVLDRLLDLVVVAVLRAWLTTTSDQRARWYSAHADGVVGPALQLLHDHPDRSWTVASLASSVGVSRAALARRFTELVGQPPITYLTELRLAMAADLLERPDATVTSVAPQVGYATPFALSAAFKRVRGLSPRDHQHRTADHPLG